MIPQDRKIVLAPRLFINTPHLTRKVNEMEVINWEWTLLSTLMVVNVLSVLVTCRIIKRFASCRRCFSFWSTEAAVQLKLFMQKMAAYNTVLAVICYCVFVNVFALDTTTTDLGQCRSLDSVRSVLLVLALCSFVAAVIRFIAMLLPHTKSVEGYIVHSPPQNPSRQALRMYGQAFMKVGFPFIVCGILFMIILGYGLFYYLPNNPDIEANFKQCFKPWPNVAGSGVACAKNVLALIGIILLPAIMTVATENAYYSYAYRGRFPTSTPGYYLILTSPFVISVFVTTWTSWVISTFVIYSSVGLYMDAFMLLFLYYCALDSIWMFTLCLVISARNKVSTS